MNENDWFTYPTGVRVLSFRLARQTQQALQFIDTTSSPLSSIQAGL